MTKKKIIPILLCALLSVLVVTTCGCTTTIRKARSSLFLLQRCLLARLIRRLRPLKLITLASTSPLTMPVARFWQPKSSKGLQRTFSPLPIYAHAHLAERRVDEQLKHYHFRRELLSHHRSDIEPRKHHQSVRPRKARSETRYREQFGPRRELLAANARKSVQ